METCERKAELLRKILAPPGSQETNMAWMRGILSVERRIYIYIYFFFASTSSTTPHAKALHPSSNSCTNLTIGAARTRG